MESVMRRRLSADEFQRMGAAGVFAADERVELIDGEVVSMAPIGIGHAGRTAAVAREFSKVAQAISIAWTQNPLRIDANTEVYPDFCLLKLPASCYDTRLPVPDDVLLLVEVAQSSLRYDRTIKLPLYARAGVPECWLVDVDHGRVVRYAEPNDGEYLRTEVLKGLVAPLAMPACAIDIAALFPPSGL